MKKIIGYYVKSLSNSTKSLSKQALFVDKPWAIIDNDGEIQKLIFKKDGGLVLSKNGKVTVGSWEYLPEARSLLVDRVTDKLLLQEQFIDESVLILRKDGTDNDFFALANENTLPDYDIVNYLKARKNNYFKIKEIGLLDGKILEVYNGFLVLDEELIGQKVDLRKGNEYFSDFDGAYMSKNSNMTFYIKNSHIVKVIPYGRYEMYSGEVIEVERKKTGLNLPRRVTMNGNAIADKKFLSGDKLQFIYVEKGFLKGISNNAIITTKDGQEIEIENGYNKDRASYVGLSVSINGMPINDKTTFEGGNIKYFVEKSRIIKVVFEKEYRLTRGLTVTIEQKESSFPTKGDKIINAKPIFPAPDGRYRIKGALRWLKIKDSFIV